MTSAATHRMAAPMTNRMPSRIRCPSRTCATALAASMSVRQGVGSFMVSRKRPALVADEAGDDRNADSDDMSGEVDMAPHAEPGQSEIGQQQRHDKRLQHRREVDEGEHGNLP